MNIVRCTDGRCCSSLTAVQQKAALEEEAKLSILEAGVTDVSTLNPTHPGAQ